MAKQEIYFLFKQEDPAEEFTIYYLMYMLAQLAKDTATVSMEKGYNLRYYAKEKVFNYSNSPKDQRKDWAIEYNPNVTYIMFARREPFEFNSTRKLPNIATVTSKVLKDRRNCITKKAVIRTLEVWDFLYSVVDIGHALNKMYPNYFTAPLAYSWYNIVKAGWLEGTSPSSLYGSLLSRVLHSLGHMYRDYPEDQTPHVLYNFLGDTIFNPTGAWQMKQNVKKRGDFKNWVINLLCVAAPDKQELSKRIRDIALKSTCIHEGDWSLTDFVLTASILLAPGNTVKSRIDREGKVYLETSFPIQNILTKGNFFMDYVNVYVNSNKANKNNNVGHIHIQSKQEDYKDCQAMIKPILSKYKIGYLDFKFTD